MSRTKYNEWMNKIMFLNLVQCTNHWLTKEKRETTNPSNYHVVLKSEAVEKFLLILGIIFTTPL